MLSVWLLIVREIDTLRRMLVGIDVLVRSVGLVGSVGDGFFSIAENVVVVCRLEC